jgi:hypothetical protein
MAADVEMASSLVEGGEVGPVMDWKELLWLLILADGHHVLQLV